MRLCDDGSANRASFGEDSGVYATRGRNAKVRMTILDSEGPPLALEAQHHFNLYNYSSFGAWTYLSTSVISRASLCVQHG